MKITGDITTAWLIHAKGVLFVLLGTLAAALLVAEMPTLKTVALLAVTVWAFCRFYYYLFYVLDRYLGRDKPFAGVVDALCFLLRKPGKREK